MRQSFIALPHFLARVQATRCASMIDVVGRIRVVFSSSVRGCLLTSLNANISGRPLEGKLKQGAKTNPPHGKPDLRTVAEMFNGVFEGAIGEAPASGCARSDAAG